MQNATSAPTVRKLPPMSATATRVLTGSGRWRVTMYRTGMRMAQLMRPYSHKDGGGLEVTRAIVANIFPGAMIEHVPDTLTGYRFEVYPVAVSE